MKKIIFLIIIVALVGCSTQKNHITNNANHCVIDDIAVDIKEVFGRDVHEIWNKNNDLISND